MPLQGAVYSGGNPLKRPLASQPSFSFRTEPDAAANDDALKKRRMHYDRMRELESQVQRVRHLGDALKQSLRQAEAQVGGSVGSLGAVDSALSTVP